MPPLTKQMVDKAVLMTKVALLCVDPSPQMTPTMKQVQTQAISTKATCLSSQQEDFWVLNCLIPEFQYVQESSVPMIPFFWFYISHFHLSMYFNFTWLLVLFTVSEWQLQLRGLYAWICYIENYTILKSLGIRYWKLLIVE